MKEVSVQMHVKFEATHADWFKAVEKQSNYKEDGEKLIQCCNLGLWKRQRTYCTG